MTHKPENSSALIPAQYRPLGIEQFRYCRILAEHGELDLPTLSLKYAENRGEEDCYVKTFNQVKRLVSQGIMTRRQITREIPPYGAMRKVWLISLTELGRERVLRTRQYFVDVVPDITKDI